MHKNQKSRQAALDSLARIPKTTVFLPNGGEKTQVAICHECHLYIPLQGPFICAHSTVCGGAFTPVTFKRKFGMKEKIKRMFGMGKKAK